VNLRDARSSYGGTVVETAQSPVGEDRRTQLLAAADRVPVTREDYLLNIAVAVTVVVAVKIVGVVLIAAFLVIPAATARLLARTFFSMTLISVAVGTLSAAVGLLASYILDLPSGAVIILVQSLVFFAAFALRL